MSDLAISTIRGQLPPAAQHELCADVRCVCERSPLFRPTTPSGAPMRVRVTAAGRLGWLGDERGYRYDDKDRRGNPWPQMPDAWSNLATEIAGPHPWDSAIVNWYDEDASLGWHRDLSERDTTLPIVTISLGDACSWAVRREDNSPISRCRLESGAVTLLAGATRNHLHSIERIIPCPMFSPLRTRGRISITIRVAG